MGTLEMVSMTKGGFDENVIAPMKYVMSIFMGKVLQGMGDGIRSVRDEHIHGQDSAGDEGWYSISEG